MVYKFFDKRAAGRGINSMPQNEQLAEELHQPIIRKLEKCIQHLKRCGADLADMQLISTFNKGFKFLLCVIDILSKYAWVVPLKGKKGIRIVNEFQSNLKNSI